MSGELPTIALVHGAFAESASWDPVIARLRDGDHFPADRYGPCDVIAIANPLRSLAGDAAYVSDVLASIDGPVVLVGHSYGGMVITEAAAGADNVVALVYVAGFAPDTGESAFQLSTMFPGSTLGDAVAARPLSPGGIELSIRSEVFHDQFCADVPAERAALMAAAQRPVTQEALSDVTTAPPAWKRLPAWFVFGEADRNIPAELSRFMADRAQAMAIHQLSGTSHAPSISEPEAVTATIRAAVAAQVEAPVGAA